MASSCTARMLPVLAAHVQGLGNEGVATRFSPHTVALPAFVSRLASTHLSSTFSCRPGFVTEAVRGCRVIAMATGDTSTDSTNPLADALKSLQEAWEKTDDKLAVGGLGFAAVIVLWASAGLIAAIDKLPLIPNVFEFVGILFSGWFIYRYLLFKPDREELWKKIQDAVSEITGQ